jgi:hypothetical protein
MRCWTRGGDRACVRTRTCVSVCVCVYVCARVCGCVRVHSCVQGGAADELPCSTLSCPCVAAGRSCSDFRAISPCTVPFLLIALARVKVVCLSPIIPPHIHTHTCTITRDDPALTQPLPDNASPTPCKTPHLACTPNPKSHHHAPQAHGGKAAGAGGQPGAVARAEAAGACGNSLNVASLHHTGPRAGQGAVCRTATSAFAWTFGTLRAR